MRVTKNGLFLNILSTSSIWQCEVKYNIFYDGTINHS